MQLLNFKAVLQNSEELQIFISDAFYLTVIIPHIRFSSQHFTFYLKLLVSEHFGVNELWVYIVFKVFSPKTTFVNQPGKWTNLILMALWLSLNTYRKVHSPVMNFIAGRVIFVNHIQFQCIAIPVLSVFTVHLNSMTTRG